MESSKKQKSAEEHAEQASGMAEEIEDPNLGKLRAVQERLFQLNEEASDKVLEIEQQYSKLRRPIYTERNEIAKQIPGFWQRVIAKHPDLNKVLTEDDVTILGSCTEVDVEDFDDIKTGYKITMKFDTNSYFKDKELVKTFSYEEGGVLRIKSTKIDWHEGFAPTEQDAAAGGKRPRDEHEYGLFLWFAEEEELITSPMQDDLAEVIKEEIWPDPFKLFAEDSDDEAEAGEGEEGEEFDDDAEAVEYEEGTDGDGQGEGEGEEQGGEDEE